MTRDQPRLRWFGTAAQIAGVFLLSSRLGKPWQAFGVMLVGSCAWSVTAFRAREWSILALNLAFTASNVLGIWRWVAP